MENRKILVWDVPTRLFHWLLVASFVGAFLTAESERYRAIHVSLGYTVLGLIAFRLIWGFVGTRYARFSSFAFGPRSVVAYVKALLTYSPRHYLGHNPAGSWMIYLVLGAALLAGATGYAAYNELGGEWIAELHEGAANAMLGLVVIHVAGVVISSLIHRENLIRAMVTGRKQGRSADAIRSKHWLVAAALLVAVAGFWGGGAGLLPASWSKPPNASADHRQQQAPRGEHG